MHKSLYFSYLLYLTHNHGNSSGYFTYPDSETTQGKAAHTAEVLLKNIPNARSKTNLVEQQAWLMLYSLMHQIHTHLTGLPPQLT